MVNHNVLRLPFGGIQYGLLNDQPVFNLTYVATILGLSNPRSNVDTSNPDYVVKIHNSTAGFSYSRKLNNTGELFLTESGLHRLLMRSNKPEAKALQKQISEEWKALFHESNNLKAELACSVGSLIATANIPVDWDGARAVLSTIYSGNQLALALDRVYQKVHNGVSVLKLSGTNL